MRQIGGRRKGSRVLQILGVDEAPPLTWQIRFLHELGWTGDILAHDAFVDALDVAMPVSTPPSVGEVALPPLQPAEWADLLLAELPGLHNDRAAGDGHIPVESLTAAG